MPLLGAHMSIAGGVHKAVEVAAEFGMDCVQVFTKSNKRWAVPVPGGDKPPPPLPTAAATNLFRAALAERGIQAPIVHNAYLINLAAVDPVLLARSRDEMELELRLAAAFGIPYVITHPGAHLGAGEEAGLRTIADSLDDVLARTADLQVGIALEVTAGQGTNLGYRFEHLARLRDLCAARARLVVCLDTCHLVAAGYPLCPEPEYQDTITHLADVVGLEHVVAVHANDSVGGLGSRVDRHAHIGHGTLGLEPFRLLLNDPRFAAMPFYLETPKEDDPETGEPWDALNLRTLRGLLE